MSDDHWSQLATDYFRQFGPAPKERIVAWAVKERLWQPSEQALIDMGAAQLGRALRAQTFTDRQGRHVRSMYAARFYEDGVQITMWNHYKYSTPEHVETALRQRRTQIAGMCHQLSIDQDWYNESKRPKQAEPLQLAFDFTRDVEELVALSRPRKRAA